MLRLAPILLLLACATTAPSPEAMSLLGQPLHRPELSEESRRERERLLAAAQRAYDINPTLPEAIIWLGRRTAYLGRYQEAIEIFSRGVRLYPDDPRFYRHRGHRYITTRQLDLAVDDLEKAASLIEGKRDQVEADGLPNRLKIPTSTLHFNIWYHLGLAHYLRGNFEAAAHAYERCLAVSKNPDSVVATAHWYYMTLRRFGRDLDAAALLDRIDTDAPVIENDSYLRLVRMYKGLSSPEELLKAEGSSLDTATIGYGVGNWLLYTGRIDEARRLFEKITSGEEWPAFGFIAAEAELARLRGT